MSGPLTNFLLRHGVDAQTAQRVVGQILSRRRSGQPQTQAARELISAVQVQSSQSRGPGGGLPGGMSRHAFFQQSSHGVSIPGSGVMEEPEEEEVLANPNPVDLSGRGIPNPDEVMGRFRTVQSRGMRGALSQRSMPRPEEVMGKVRFLASKVAAGM